MYKIYLSLFLVAAFFSCKKNDGEKNNEKNNEKIELTKKIVKIESIEIPIPNDIKYSYSHKQVIDSIESSKLLVSNLNDNGFVIFDLEKKSFIKKINYKRVGPDGLLSSSSGRKFYYHNKDSIFIFGQQTKKIFLTNDKSEVMDVFYLPSISNFDVGEPIVENRIPVFLKNNILSFCAYPFIGSGSDIRKAAEGPVIVNLNLKTRKLIEGQLTYKLANQYNQHPALHFPSGTTNGRDNIFCFPFDNKIYIVGENKYSTINFNSVYVDDYQPFTKELQFTGDFNVTGTYNELILYDKYRDLYYLFISLGIEKINSKNGDRNEQNQKPFSILVFDKNINKLHEQKFEGSTYLALNSFISSKGLYLFKNNPENSEFDENYYKFDIFNFIK